MTDFPQFKYALAEWQEAFVSSFLTSPKSRALLVAAAGTGKTVTSLHLSKRMIDSGIVDGTLVLTDRLVLRDQWANVAANFGIDLTRSFKESEMHDGSAVTVQSLLRSENLSVLKDIGSAKRWLVIS